MIMKKYFIFAAVAAAGLFASCSSSDDIASNDVGAIENPDARQAIRLNLATPGSMASRGTGTVGGVGSENQGTHYSANVWAGQTINVFMFTKGTEATAAVNYQSAAEYNADKGTELTDEQFAALDASEKVKTPAGAADPYATTLKLTETDASTTQNPDYFYDNLAMYTPGSAANKIDGMNASLASGEAMITDGTINYYPPQGNFDFFGYHGDDAVATTSTITKTDALWTVPFTIDGTQDLMSTKAELTTNQNTTMTGAPAAHQQDYYSAYAARKGVHPTLTFKHLLTRLQFSVKAGNAAAAGNEGGSPATYYTAAEADAANALLNGALGANETVWTFEAGAPSGQQAWPVNTTGFVKKIKEQDENTTTYTIVQCIKNTTGNNPDPDPFLNQYFALPATNLTALDFNQDVALYAVTKNNDDYTIGAAIAGVSLKGVQASTPAAYNATLNGAVAENDKKTSAVPAGQNIANAVKVTSIQVLSENTKGDLAVAWTGAKADYEKITWAATQPAEADRWLTLMERPYAAKKATATAAAAADFTDGATLADAVTAAETAAAADPDDQDKQNALNAAQKALADLLALEKATISETVYNMLSTDGKAKYDAIDAAEVANQTLTDLTPTYPDTDLAKTKKVGESIILSPGTYDANGVAQIGDPLANTAKLRMKVALEQNVPTNWNTPTVRTPKTQEYELEIKAPDGGFKQNTSYNIILTVYGLERIEVIAVVEPWGDGGNIEVGQD